MALLVALHMQPVAVVTGTVVSAPPPRDSRQAATDGKAAGAENEKVLDGALRALPPGPTAATVDV